MARNKATGRKASAPAAAVPASPWSDPETIAATKARIVSEMVEGGHLLPSICKSADMPSRSTVYRWLRDDADFAASVEQAREAMADHIVSLARDAVDTLKAEDAPAVRIKLLHWHWEAARLAPQRYSEKRMTEITGKGGGPIKTETREAPLDLSPLDPEERNALKALLVKCSTGGKADADDAE